jgi:hypothetical protein
MARDLRFPVMPVAEEFDVGDDSDLPGYGQPITQDDIDAVLSAASESVEERRALLLRMLDDMSTRQGMDQSHEYDGLVRQIQDALATLALPGDGLGTPDAYALDDSERAEQPDEVLERAEDEAEDARKRGVD